MLILAYRSLTENPWESSCTEATHVLCYFELTLVHLCLGIDFDNNLLLSLLFDSKVHFTKTTLR